MSKMARSVANGIGVDIYHVNLYVRQCGVRELSFEEVPLEFTGFKVRS